ncbi:hypothetical protein DI09_50p20 [Mitosporidium daphniae]|uniref:CS domain-containing protein n=1 Tax=Mitosporidium daphniae TaxID=1485682 RepID=A0A098VPN6_9MICR|nr:uncharacterized protein DI09_50p20 [Mitosporidium daphniae]KGG50895.1 hypothetical protein DI09_50p20 [Mitosporidium daphniae]|eukprot:XP_013237341.1 uncharacterized protein DI09_50p20 [Mitosporidium daphniae]
MITPVFWLDQSNDRVFITLKVPLIRAQEVEFTIDPQLFHCYAKPYYLRLSLPGSVKQDGTETAKLDLERGLLSFSIAKAIPGQQFPNLDLVGELLRNPSACVQPSINSLVSEVDQSPEVILEAIDPNDDHNRFNFHDEETDFFVEQQEPSYGYGFNCMYTDFFKDFPRGSTLELFDLESPEKTSFDARRALQQQQESTSFNEDAYMYLFSSFIMHA